MQVSAIVSSMISFTRRLQAIPSSCWSWLSLKWLFSEVVSVCDIFTHNERGKYQIYFWSQISYILDYFIIIFPFIFQKYLNSSLVRAFRNHLSRPVFTHNERGKYQIYFWSQISYILDYFIIIFPFIFQKYLNSILVRAFRNHLSRPVHQFIPFQHLLTVT